MKSSTTESPLNYFAACSNYSGTTQLRPTPRFCESCFSNASHPTSGWCSLLPPTLWSMDLVTLANMAYKVIEVVTPSVSALTQPASLDPQIQQLRAEVSRLAELVASLTTRPCTGSCGQSRDRPHSSPTPTDSLQPSDALCWYHKKFENLQRNASNPAVGETPRPDTSGDRCSRPYV